MYKLYWNDQVVISVPKAAYKDVNEMKKAFAKMFKVNPRYIRVEEVQVKEVG